MSIEIPRAVIGKAQARINYERVDDWVLVVGAVSDAERAGTPLGDLDEVFKQEVADKRLAKARDEYAYPVEGAEPTPESSLQIVDDILTIQELNRSRDTRLAGVDLRGSADIELLGAELEERAHRLREKGILRVFDHVTRQSMWSVEFDK